MSLIPAARKRDRPDFSLAIINIVFLLLLFYLATGSLITPREESISAPLTETLPLEKLPRPLLIVERDGLMVLDGVTVAPATMTDAARRATSHAAALNVLASRGLAARSLLTVLTELDGVGVPVRLVTLRGSPLAGEGP